MWRVRRTFGTAVTWAAGWGLAVAVATALVAIASGWTENLRLGVQFLGLLAAWAGFVAGGLFDVVLRVWYGGRLQELTATRVALWGALVGALLPGGVMIFSPSGGDRDLVAIMLVTTGCLAALGALTAGRTVERARRAEQQSRNLAVELPSSA